MHILFDCKTSLTGYQEIARQVSERLIQHIPQLEQHIVIPPNASVEARWAGRPALFVIEEGCLQISSAQGALLVYEEGDIVGADASPFYPLSIETSGFPTVVSVYSSEAVRTAAAENTILNNLWNDYLCASSRLFLSVLAERVHINPDPIPAIRVFHEGDEIVRQGIKGDTVFTMVEGEASVVVDGHAVGEVHKDEIFGAIAAITGSERNASVIARSTCVVMELQAAQFQALLQTHPALITRLIKDMARTIKSLNRELVSASQASL